MSRLFIIISNILERRESLAYSEDTDIIVKSQRVFTCAFVYIKTEVAKMGLVVHESKTKYMLTKKDTQYPIRLVKQEVVQHVPGVKLHSNTIAEIKRRIIFANIWFFAPRRQLRIKPILPTTKKLLYSY